MIDEVHDEEEAAPGFMAPGFVYEAIHAHRFRYALM
jgi:hypothetical protein